MKQGCFEVKHAFRASKNVGNLSEAPAATNPLLILIEERNVKVGLGRDLSLIHI